MNFTETDLGFIQEKDGHLIFFGKKSATLDLIKQAYPKLSFRMIHQKHSDICISSLPDSQDTVADAHFTFETNVGLIIKTADCLPVVAFSKKQNLILAIHAGWRGVENQITTKSLRVTKMHEAEIFIGPHILQKSFEVDFDVKEQLERTYLQVTDNPAPRAFIASGQKFYVNLQDILKAQIESIATSFQLHTLTIDTVSDLRMHSFRREKQSSGRNLSFIARLQL